MILLSSAYFGPIQYFSKWASVFSVNIEAHENFIKQTYRNRCEIVSANGMLKLSVPVLREDRIKIPIKETKIDYDTLWQKQHLRAIESAYRRSPYYEYYIDEFIPFFEKKTTFLYDLNYLITETILDILGWDKQIGETNEYIPANTNPCNKNTIPDNKDINSGNNIIDSGNRIIDSGNNIIDSGNNIIDFRTIIGPGNKGSHDPTFRNTAYIQNFEEKYGFIPNLSVLDLIFQTGPEAKQILHQTWNPLGI